MLGEQEVSDLVRTADLIRQFEVQLTTLRKERDVLIWKLSELGYSQLAIASYVQINRNRVAEIIKRQQLQLA